MPPRSLSNTANSSPPRRAGVARSGGGADPVGDRLQELVTDSVSERIVDRLEIVEIDEQHDNRIGLRSSDPQRVVDAVEVERTVGEPGQLVVECAVAQLDA